MFSFTSDREKRLWLWALAVVLAIYATLGLAQTLAGRLCEQGLISAAIWFSLFLIGLTILALAWKRRPGGAEIGIGLGIAAVYLLLFLRMAIPEERSHLVEYSVLAAFIHQALIERSRNIRLAWSPAISAIGITALLGFVDEAIQLFLPNRFFDLRDIAFNALAALMAVAANVLLAWVRTRFSGQKK